MPAVGVVFVGVVLEGVVVTGSIVVPFASVGWVLVVAAGVVVEVGAIKELGVVVVVAAKHIELKLIARIRTIDPNWKGDLFMFNELFPFLHE